MLAIDESDADAPTRAAFCGKGDPKDPSSCRITTREQLIAFARATAARRRQNGGLAILLPPAPEAARTARGNRIKRGALRATNSILRAFMTVEFSHRRMRKKNPISLLYRLFHAR